MNLLVAQFGIGPFEILLFGVLVIGIIAIIPLIIYFLKKADSKNKDKSEEEIKQIVAEKSSIMTEKYLQMFYERVDLDKLVKDVALEVYAKNFTTEEIKNITAFYKTPTGAKARKVMPKVARESMQLTQKLIRPELKEIVKAVMEEK